MRKGFVALVRGMLFVMACIALPASAHTDSATVVIDEKGFSPSEATVDKQQTVIFFNRDRVDHWPASDFHPTHGLYPEFDPTSPIKPGQSWAFQPREEGVWEYHDHLQPQSKGTLIVAAEEPSLLPAGAIDKFISEVFDNILNVLKNVLGLASDSDTTAGSMSMPDGKEDVVSYTRRALAACLQNGATNDCYKAVANFLYQKLGLKESLALLAENEEHREVYARCHEVTHYLSRHEFEKVGSIPGVYTSCDSTCHGGCYHGALEAYLSQEANQSPYENLDEKFTQICGAPGDYENLLIFNECRHGLGHAAMFVTNTDLPRSLRMCDNLPTPSAREYCYSGVFMENSSSSTNINHPSQYLRADDPYYPCNMLEEKYLRLCYRYQSSHFSLITHHDWGKVAELCLGVPETYREECFRTVGTNQVGFTKDMNVWNANCQRMPTAYRAICYQGVVSSLAYRFVGNVNKVEDFCQLAPKQYQEACFGQLGIATRDWSDSFARRQAWCSELFSPSFQEWCMQGVKL